MEDQPQDIQTEQALERLFAPEGPLAAHLPGYAPRAGQQEMAQMAARAFRQGVPLLAEAGTGTGKTLAYLLPLILSGYKAVVTTGTRTLQDQIAGKELPFIKKALAPHLRWAVLKGRANYLCLRRYLAFARQPDLALPGVKGALPVLAAWVAAGASGDMDEVRGEGVAGQVLAEVTSNSEQCLGSRCPNRENCRLMEARRAAAEADLVVVNHHLFLSDLKLKAAGHGEVLPRYQAVVFDEAHLVPDVATQIFGVSVSSPRLVTLLKDVARHREARNLASARLAQVEAAGAAFFNRVAGILGPGGRAGLMQEDLEALSDPGAALSEALTGLAGKLGEGEEEECENLALRAGALSLDLTQVAKPELGRTVAWGERNRGGAALNLSPVEVGPHLEHALYAEMGRLVFTSATLAAGRDLTAMRLRLGLASDTLTFIAPSPFDLARQAVLYVPADMPPPSNPGFAAAVAAQVEKLLSASRGRAFVLFTTHKNLKEVSQRLRDRLPYPCLVQGSAPRQKLLRRFVDESPSVLFATASFWQGVDVPGAALSAVIVDKLPFSPPDDPLVAARCHLAEEDGLSSFAHLLVPEAILSLKQGLGRLLRTATDRGLLAVLDVRLLNKGYGKRFLTALAPIPVTSDLKDVERFFDSREVEEPLPF